MGLDVYLNKYDDFDDAERREKEYTCRTEKERGAYDDYRKLTKFKRDKIDKKCAEIAASLGLDECGSAEPQTRYIEWPSTKHPKHLFKIGYFRSSYNGSGINRVLKAKCGTTLYDIFDNNDGNYKFRPDWAKARDRAIAALEALRKSYQDVPYRAMCIHIMKEDKETAIKDESEALQRFMKTIQSGAQGSFSDRNGDFFLPSKDENDDEPIKIRALLSGIDAFDNPCVWAVYKDEGSSWYEQALEIVIETCDYVLSQPDSQKYVLHWSS